MVSEAHRTEDQLLDELNILREHLADMSLYPGNDNQVDKMQAFLDQWAIGVFICDLTGTVVFANQAIEGILGYEADNLVGKPILSLSSSQHIECLQAFLEKLACQKQSGTSEQWLVGPCGGLVPLLMGGIGIQDTEGAVGHLAITAIDIREQKLAENELRKNENKYRMMFEDSPVSLWEVDFSVLWDYVLHLQSLNIVNFQTFFQDYPDQVHKCLAMIRIVNVNNETMRLYGARCKEQLCVGLDEIFSENTFSVMRDLLIGIMGKQERFETVAIHRTLEGDPLFVRLKWVIPWAFEPSPKQVLISITDITAQRYAEEALQDSRMRARLLLDTMPSGLFTVDLDQRITSWNRQAEEILGIKAKDVLGLRCIDAFDCDACKRGCGLYDDHLEKPLFARECTIHVGKKDIIISKNMNLIRDKHGQVIGGLESFIDISHHKALEQEKQALAAQLHRSQRLETIGTLAGGIAHDFNNILTPILGYVEMALESIDLNDAIYSDLLHVSKAALRARDLVKQILTFSRQVDYDRVPVSASLVIEEVTDFIRRVIPKRIQIVKKIVPDAGTILADSTQIHQVLLNLCTNAHLAMEPEGGILEIELTPVRVDEIFVQKHPQLNADRVLCISVRDTGMGMDETTRDRIFEPFFTTRPVGEGSGLGLSVVHGIVKAHGGCIEVESTPGVGTTFDIYLPVIDGAPVAVPTNTAARWGSVLGRKGI